MIKKVVYLEGIDPLDLYGINNVLYKKIVIASFLWWFFISFAFSQNGEHVGGGHFVKRVEYNVLSPSDKQRLFFGDFNAAVEFSYLPSSEAALNEELISGFRIVRNSSNILEVKYISNYKEAYKEAEKKYPIIAGNITSKYNKTALANQHEEMSKLYKIETLSFPVSDRFADNLYKKMVSLIDNFKAKGIPPVIFDGYSVSFRTVVDDEVWSLLIQMPQGDALKMAHLCRQIITNAMDNQLDEEKYITVVNTIGN